MRSAPVAAGLVAAVVLATAPAASARTLTIRVVSVSLSVQAVDAPPKGPSRGDRVVYRDRLLNARAQFGRKKGARVGTDRGTLTFTGAHAARFAGVAVLPGGTIRLEGAVRALRNGALRIPVAGGTGRFARARGTLTVGSGAKRALNVYRLVLPASTIA